MKIVLRLTIMLVSLSFTLVGQDTVRNCKCESYISRFAFKTDTTNKAFYKKLQHLVPDCFEVNLLKDSADFFYIQPFQYNEKHKNEKVWIKKKDQFFVTLKGDKQGNFVLYSFNTSNSKKVFTSKYENTFPQADRDLEVSVLNCNGDWLKVKLKFKKKIYIGWTKTYCPLGCTTCN